MRHKDLAFSPGFRVAFEVRGAQAAEMVIAPGGHEGGPDNRHQGAEQWLFVHAGSGEARIGGGGDDAPRRVPLQPGSLLVIERGEAHEIRNTGQTPLQTLNIYVPPAFGDDGEPRGPGRG